MERATATRERLVAAAEELFAAQGIDAVSLREINRAAGAKNGNAIHYWFGDRAGLLRAVFAKHQPEIEARRHALLDQCETCDPPDLRSLAGALVRPLAAKLADPDGGPAFLRVNAELLSRPRRSPPAAAPADPADSVDRWRMLVAPLLPAGAVALHRRFTAMRFAASELGSRASTAPHTDDRLFTSQLVDLVTGLLVAPVSAETARLASDRPVSRQRARRAG